ncbi:hypothetical protein ACHAO4_004487 [Trichoderma viride]
MRTSDQIRDLGDQSSNRFDNLDHGLLKCMDLLQILLQSREEATDTLRILLSGLQKAPTPDQIPVGHNGIDFQHILAQRGEDLEAVVNWGPKVDPSAQAQARSILDQDRFLQWMSSEHPDMLLIDRKLFTRGSVSIEKISAMSLFCAYFILSMNSLDSSHVLLHFRCGLHFKLGDKWYGPTGLVRSLIIQVLVILHNRGLLDLNILDRRSFVQALENHSLDELYLNGLFKEFATVLECLQRIVEDDNLRPKFKVLMTSPTNTSWRLSQVADKKHRLGLPSMRMAPLPLSQARMKTALGSGRPE